MTTANQPVAGAGDMAPVHAMVRRCAVLAAIGVTLLAACSDSGSNSAISLGEFGALPAAHGAPVSGRTVTVAAQAGQMPLWILPLTPTADATTATVPGFDYLMWRPLYWTVNGVEPTVVPSMSLAKPPVWSNGDKTATITMNGYKWSDGQPVSSRDLLFDLDLIKAALKENASNWAWYTPGFLPDDIASTSTPNASTLVIKLKSAVNPTWFEEDELGPLQPMPSRVWARATAAGPVLDFTQPANARKIYDFLAAASRSPSTYPSNPLWRTVDGPFKLTSFNAVTGAYAMTANAAYTGPRGGGKITAVQMVPFTSDAAELDAVLAGTIDVGYVPLQDVPRLPQVKRVGYDVFGSPDFGFSDGIYNFRAAPAGRRMVCATRLPGGGDPSCPSSAGLATGRRAAGRSLAGPVPGWADGHRARAAGRVPPRGARGGCRAGGSGRSRSARAGVAGGGGAVPGAGPAGMGVDAGRPGRAGRGAARGGPAAAGPAAAGPAGCGRAGAAAAGPDRGPRHGAASVGGRAGGWGGSARAGLVSLGITEFPPRVEEAQQHLEQGVALARRIGRPYLEFSGLAYQARTEIISLPARAAKRARQAIELAERHGWTSDPAACYAYAILATVLTWQGQLEEAEPWVQRAEYTIRAEAEPMSAWQVCYVRGLLELARGHDADALAALRVSERPAGHLAATDYVTEPSRALRVQALVRLGELEQAGQALAGFGEQDRERGEPRIALAVLRLAQDDPYAATLALAPVLDGSVSLVPGAWLAQAFILEAIARDVLGDPAAAGRALERALDLAEPHGVLTPFVLHPAPSLLERQARQRAAHATLIAEILALLGGSGPRGMVGGQPPMTRAGPGGIVPRRVTEPLSKSETRVLRYLPTHLSAPEIAGELSVSTTT